MKKKFLILAMSINLLRAEQNNVCSDYLGYLAPDLSKNCYHSTDLYKSVPELTAKYTGLTETHNITTQDGYILTVFRIPAPDPSKGVILLHHPLNTDANIWMNQENESIALYFWHLGYDVWLPNDRGTKYSRSHLNLTVGDKEFWDFSFHEIGVFDAPAVTDYIFELTQKKIVYIGHSLATTGSLIYASLMPKDAEKKIRIVVNMAPIAFLRHVRGPAAIGFVFQPIIKKILDAFGYYDFLYFNSGLVKVLNRIAINLPFKFLINILFSAYSGWTLNEFDPRFFNQLFSQFPSGTSTKVLYHFCQVARNGGDFRMYDYGELENFKKYQNKKPPSYPLQNITVPFYLVYSEDDKLSSQKDVEFLITQMPQNVQKLGHMKLTGINHVDYHYGKDRMRIYEKIAQVIDIS